MSKLFLCVPTIGNLYIRHVLIQYDHPLVFVCEDDFDSIYIFNEITDCEDFEEWISLKITRKKYFDLVESRITFQQAFEKTLNVPYLIVKHEYASETVTCNLVYEPDPDYLPMGDIYMSMISDEQELVHENDTDSEILEIETYPNQSIGGINVKIHNKLCDSIVGILDGMYKNDVYAELLQPKAASYAIRLKVNSINKSKTSATEAIEKISSTVNPSGKVDYGWCEDEIKVKQQSMEFLNAVSQTKKDVILVYDDKSRKKVFDRLPVRECSIRAKEIKEVIRQDKIKLHVPKERSFNVEGALITYDLKNKKFVFQYEEEKENKDGTKKLSKKEYIGKLSDNFSEKQFVGFDCFYQAEIRQYEDETLELISLKQQNELFPSN